MKVAFVGDADFRMVPVDEIEGAIRRLCLELRKRNLSDPSGIILNLEQVYELKQKASNFLWGVFWDGMPSHAIGVIYSIPVFGMSVNVEGGGGGE